jgi:hypothetical protein
LPYSGQSSDNIRPFSRDFTYSTLVASRLVCAAT